jgi:hypothetical protein
MLCSSLTTTFIASIPSFISAQSTAQLRTPPSLPISPQSTSKDHSLLPPISRKKESNQENQPERRYNKVSKRQKKKCKVLRKIHITALLK